MSSIAFQVNRSDLSESRYQPLRDYNEIALDGGAVLQVEKFALTANNITYGVAGDLIGYWQFFPAELPWGHIPVWGIGTVVRSGHPDLNTGDRYYGYFPMASYLLVKPEKVTVRGFADGASHRSELPAVYNQYSLMTEENGFKPGFDDHQMIYKPLFTTSFVLNDFLEDNSFFGAEKVILSSASSKTSFGLAYLLNQSKQVNVVGLTSVNNRGFVDALGVYDQTVTYDELGRLAAAERVVYVDMAGNRSVLAELHNLLKDNMAYSCGVGITHWDSRDGEDPASLPGARPRMFFAPDQIQKRHRDWGAQTYQANLANAWEGFIGKVDDWVEIVHGQGDEAVEKTYQRVLQGAPPNEGYVLAIE